MDWIAIAGKDDADQTVKLDKVLQRDSEYNVLISKLFFSSLISRVLVHRSISFMAKFDLKLIRFHNNRNLKFYFLPSFQNFLPVMAKNYENFVANSIATFKNPPKTVPPLEHNFEFQSISYYVTCLLQSFHPLHRISMKPKNEFRIWKLEPILYFSNEINFPN